MLPLLVQSSPDRDDVFKALLKQRARPQVIILDADLNVLFVDSDAVALLQRYFRTYHPTSALPRELRDAVAALIRRSGAGADPCEDFVVPANGLVVRVVPLWGSDGNRYALYLEKEARREDLKEAARRFLFTRRELEVLDLILAGFNASEIAVRLHIAEVTVFDHFKHISHKTNARNRADMLAKIFNWQTPARR